MKLSSKIKGIFNVSASNLLSLSISMLTSFILPYFISVEEYGYWQLFILYCGYVGFFILGFNDGIHLNYATESYTWTLASKFNSFKRFIILITGVETLLLVTYLIISSHNTDRNFWILLLVILNIIPQGLMGMFSYMNQATMRYKYYATGCVVDKLIFTVLMIFLLCLNASLSIYYVTAYTIARYCVIIYHYFTSNEVFTSAAIPLSQLKGEIRDNFKMGFPLMIATILNGSMIVGSQFLIKGKFGIESFSAYSFSIHTLVIASQFITSVTSVFYPILKRNQNALGSMYSNLDKTSSLLSAALLLSYYPAAILILLVYQKYSIILEYLMFVYPLFIFQCKSNLLIINTYKVKGDIKGLVLASTLAIILHLLFIYIAYLIFGTIPSIAFATLLAYIFWYYSCQRYIYKSSGWNSRDLPIDFFVVIIFIGINFFMNKVLGTVSILNFVYVLIINIAIYTFIFVFTKGRIKEVLKETNNILKD